MVRPLTWRFWAGIAAVVAAYCGMFFVLGNSGRFDDDFLDIGLIVQVLAPVLFVAAYSIATRFWWRKIDMSANLVLVELGTLPQAVVLLITFGLHHGILDTAGLAWAFVGGPWFQGVFLMWRSFMVLRAQRDVTETQSDPEP